MVRARVVVDRDFTAGEVPRRIFGSFVEHMGRCVYTGIFEPGHPTADEDGFRSDVLDLTREMGVSVVRYPGGNFVSGYRWEDGVGPVADRPHRLDGAWHTIETNAFGLHEFMALGAQGRRRADGGDQPRHPRRARRPASSSSTPTTPAAPPFRPAAPNGAAEPVRHQALVPRQRDGRAVADRPQDRRGVRPARAGGRQGDAVRRPRASSWSPAAAPARTMPTFGAWEQTVLAHAYDEVDYVSHARLLRGARRRPRELPGLGGRHGLLHRVGRRDRRRGRARPGKSRKKINMSFDEWNVWYQRRETADAPSQVRPGRLGHHPRLIEDNYTVTDAVVVGTFLDSLLRHGDRVKIANQAQLVNVIAPILTEPGGAGLAADDLLAVRRTSALARGRHPAAARRRRPTDTPRYGDVDLVDVSGTYDAETGTVALFLANRAVDEAADVEVDLRGLTAEGVLGAEVLTVPEGGDRHTVNAAGDERVRLRPLEGVTVAPTGVDVVRLRLPALSWAAVQLRRRERLSRVGASGSTRRSGRGPHRRAGDDRRRHLQDLGGIGRAAVRAGRSWRSRRRCRLTVDREQPRR